MSQCKTIYHHHHVSQFCFWDHQLCFVLFFCTHAECKLSRPGPPATIVTIDEESPNGTFWSASLLLVGLSLLHIVPFALQWQTLFLRSSGMNSTVGTASAHIAFVTQYILIPRTSSGEAHCFAVNGEETPSQWLSGPSDIGDVLSDVLNFAILMFILNW